MEKNTSPREMNQCDGCQRNLAKNQYGMHLEDGRIAMSCTAKLYNINPPEEQSEDRVED